MTKPQRTYTVALIVIAFIYVITIGEFVLLIRHPLTEKSEQISFAFEFSLFCCALYLAVILLILLTLFRWPERGRLLLVALNIILLFGFPFGTVLGIYYLWKINKRDKLNAGQNIASTNVQHQTDHPAET